MLIRKGRKGWDKGEGGKEVGWGLGSKGVGQGLGWGVH